MCDIIYRGNEEIIAENQKQLADFVGIDNLVFAKHFKQIYDAEACLCSIDIAVTLTKAGIKFTDDGCMEWTINA
jgi:hypothetical protein